MPSAVHFVKERRVDLAPLLLRERAERLREQRGMINALLQRFEARWLAEILADASQRLRLDMRTDVVDDHLADG